MEIADKELAFYSKITLNPLISRLISQSWKLACGLSQNLSETTSASRVIVFFGYIEGVKNNQKKYQQEITPQSTSCWYKKIYFEKQTTAFCLFTKSIMFSCGPNETAITPHFRWYYFPMTFSRGNFIT